MTYQQGIIPDGAEPPGTFQFRVPLTTVSHHRKKRHRFVLEYMRRAERVKWPLQRLVHNLSRQEYINTHHGKDDDTKSNDAQHKSETTSGTRGPVYGAAAAVEGYKAHPEVDASVERALRKFFPPELKEVEVDDMYSAGTHPVCSYLECCDDADVIFVGLIRER